MNGSQTFLAFKALRELSPRQLGLFALYRAGLKTGYFRWKTSARRQQVARRDHPSAFVFPLLGLPNPDVILEIIGPEGLSKLRADADEIVEGRVRIFGGPPVPLNLTPPGTLSHWTEYARGKSPFPNSQSVAYPIPDIKFIWEPARFGWAFTLGRAYHLTKDERYPETFWQYYEIFHQANPPNLGPNWESAQEISLRILAFIFAAQTFKNSSHTTATRTLHLARSISEHAVRIPPTLIYARAQNNNHLLSEATGLITAALALPEHPQAEHWSKLGWKWFNRGLESQIDESGSYMQQSTNYHRLMLQLALWVFQMQNMKNGKKNGKAKNQQISRQAIKNLQKATQWLLNLLDKNSGRVPNLGANDGAYILPLTNLPHADYRPVLQAASNAFLGETVFEPGPWDEMAAWLYSDVKGQGSRQPARGQTPATIHSSYSWAYLRAATFRDRPGHADQLHLDLWWRGLNVAQDAGTYLYNADPPWDNALTHTAVHNTVMIDDHQQMTPAGRFLYLDRAQAVVLKREQAEDGSWKRIKASHDGYQRLGMMHTRSVIVYKDDRWLIEDYIRPLTSGMLEAAHHVRLHWLLPDWEWKIDNSQVMIEMLSPYGWIQLGISEGIESSISNLQISILRAGELLHGSANASPTWGWISPTYGVKKPALSIVVTATCALPVAIVSKWSFPEV